MMITTTLGAALASCAIAGAPAPACDALLAFATPYAPVPGHGLYSHLLEGVPTDNGNLLVPLAFPFNRTDTTTYTNAGRLWAPSTPYQKMLSGTYPGNGPAAFGAPLDQGDLAFFVRPDSEPWPDVLLSPWQEISEDTIDEMIRRRPWLRRSPSRTDRMVAELRSAQHEFLRQRGLILNVRTHVNPHALRHDAPPAATPPGVEPSGVLRLRPANPGPNPNSLRTSLPGHDAITRVSLPADPTPETRITVVRQENLPESAGADQG